MSRPVIGLTCYDPSASWGAWTAEVSLIPTTYIESVSDSGGAPVVLPIGNDVAALLDRIDALILVGGPDVDPDRYGEPRGEFTQPARGARDAFEFELAVTALQRDLPMLAICRGLQVLNVVRGGTLHQHLPDLLGTTVHAPSPGHFGEVNVEVTPGSQLAAILGATSATVQCSHHQSIDRLGSDLVVVATSEGGVIEGVEDPAMRFLLGVQWHPEAGSDLSLFEAVVSAASAS